jgi:acyl-CoA thioesterase-1
MRGWSRRLLVGILLTLGQIGCGSDTEGPPDLTNSPRPASPSSESAAGPLVIFLGNSLTAGYGLREDQAFPALWAETFRNAGHEVRLVNAGISGDTTAGGLARIDWLLRQEPDVLVLGLGANDGLRGLSLAQTRANLDEIIDRSLAAGARVLLLGMKIPPSYGADYSNAFESLFVDLAESNDVALMPFLLAEIAADPEFNQADGIHPNAAGHQRLAAAVAPYLEEILRDPG